MGGTTNKFAQKRRLLYLYSRAADKEHDRLDQATDIVYAASAGVSQGKSVRGTRLCVLCGCGTEKYSSAVAEASEAASKAAELALPCLFSFFEASQLATPARRPYSRAKMHQNVIITSSMSFAWAQAKAMT
eukprot:1161533-Pelagomonas_calceolata.AAC.5